MNTLQWNLIEIPTFSFKKMRLKVSSAKWRPCCLGLNVLTLFGSQSWVSPNEPMHYNKPNNVYYLLLVLAGEFEKADCKYFEGYQPHYGDVIMGMVTSQITSLTIVYSIVYSGADQGSIKAPSHWPLCGEFTSDRWIPHTNGQLRGKFFHLMMSSCTL